MRNKLYVSITFIFTMLVGTTAIAKPRTCDVSMGHNNKILESVWQDGYKQALSIGRKAKPTSLISIILRSGKFGFYCGIAGASIYAGYCAYKKFAWIRNGIKKVHDKIQHGIQKWLDITEIKKRIDLINIRIETIIDTIKTLMTDQTKIKDSLNEVGSSVNEIKQEIKAGFVKGELKTRLDAIEGKIDVISKSVINKTKE